VAEQSPAPTTTGHSSVAIAIVPSADSGVWKPSSAVGALPVLDPRRLGGPFSPARYGGVEIVYVDRTQGLDVLLMPDDPFV